jgi:TonB-linked SusC/RagA family outer membrane protein
MKNKFNRQLIMGTKFILYGFVLQLIFLASLLANESSAQGSKSVKEVKLDLFCESKSILEIFKIIESETPFVFFYETRHIDKKVRLDFQNNDISVGDILLNISMNSNLKFKQINNRINVTIKDPKSKEDSNLIIIIQTRNITGKVTSREDAQGLPGVNVIEKGTNNGTVTDVEGRYSLSVSVGATLVFSSVGYTGEEIMVGNRQVIDLVMVQDIRQLEELVVIGYGTQEKVNLTGAIGYVDSKVLESRPITNLGQGLQGVVANLNITSISGAPGRGVEFNVRGTTSINGGSPLVLVDGVQMDPNIINPQDVKSISVLKDAASAAIYGARAAFGVILITTKSGVKNQKPVVSVASNYSVNRPTVVPEYMNSIEYTSYTNEGYITTNGRPYFDEETMQHVRAYFNDPINNSPVFHHSSDASNFWRYAGNTDWMKELLKDNYPMQQYTLSINGGTENVSYYTSLGYFNQKGISKPADENYDRFNFRQSVSYDVSKWLNLTAKGSVNSSSNRLPPQHRRLNRNYDNMFISGDSRPLMPVYHPDGNYAGYSGNGYFTNSVALLKQGGYQQENVTDFWLTGAMKLTPFKSLTVNVDYTYNSYNDETLSYVRSYWDYDAHGPATLYPHTTPNAVRRSNNNNKYTSFNVYSEYTNTFSAKHFITGIIGFNQELVVNGWFEAQRQKLISNEIPYMSLASGDRFANDSGSEYAIRGVFGRLNYVFDDKYLLEINGRYDGSSRFPSADRFKYYPSASVGWRISNESFFAGLRNVINELKPRASYGNLGNQSVAAYYPYVATYGTSEMNYLLSGDRPMAVTAPGLVSPSLTWETVTQINFGLDFGLFENKLQGTIDIYRRDTKDMLTSIRALSSVLGTNEPQANAADMKTNGFEVTLSYNRSFMNDLKINTEVIFSDYQSVITKFDNPNNVISDYYVGKKIGEIWGFETEGLFQTDEEATKLDQSQIAGHKFLAGDIKFKDQNGDNKITRGSQTLDNHGDLKIIGNSTPRYSYGLKAGVDWKNFDLNIFFQGVGKRDVNAATTYFLAHYGSEWSVPQKINTDYWTQDNPNAYFPRPRVGGAPEITQTQTRFLQNAAYLRLKQFTIGYTIPKNVVQVAGIERFRIYFSGNNLWETTKMLNIFDPEITATNRYPLTRAVSMGLNFTLL